MPEGQVLKSEQDVLGGMVVYRTTKEAAKAPAGPVKFDLILSSVVKVARKIANPDQTRHVKYRVTLKDSDPRPGLPDRLPPDAREQKAGEDSAILEIKSTGPLDGEAVAGRGRPRIPQAQRAGDQRRHPGPQPGAAGRLAGVVDPWEKATRDQPMGLPEYPGQELQGRLRRGGRGRPQPDRRLHRALRPHRGHVPGRRASRPASSIGLIYVDELEGFGYHMWDEVFVNHRWVAIDPSLDQTTVDAVHIKLSDTSLDGVAPFEAFLPVVAVVGRLTIEPIEIR